VSPYSPSVTVFPDVIDRIADHPASQLDDLLPWNWQLARQQKAA
jgi:hypothetical protein